MPDSSLLLKSILDSAQFWAVLLVLFGLAFAIPEFLAYLERKVSYYAASR